MVSVWKTPHCASRQCQIRAVKLWRTYRNTAENLSDEERLDILGSEEDGGEAHEQGETADDGPTVTKLLGDPAVDEETDDGADVCTVTKAGLPRCGDFVRAVGLQLSILLPPLGKSVETIDQSQIETFHGNASGYKERPGNGLGVEAKTLHEGHLVLLVSGGPGLVDSLFASIFEAGLLLGGGVEFLVVDRVSHDELWYHSVVAACGV